jgi:glycosyltransferase involved in cell wall biosynthesis
MRVLIVAPQMSYYGGAELLVVKFSNLLTEKGITNKVLSLSKSEQVEKDLNTEIIVPKNDVKISSKGFESVKDLIKGILALRRGIKKLFNDFDVINFHNFPATWSLFPKKKPSVWMCNEPPSLWSRPDAGVFLRSLNKIRNFFDRFIVRKSVTIVCVSDEFNKNRVKKRYGMDSKIVNYGIDYDFFSKGNKSKAVNKFKLKNKFVVIQSGVLSKQKNQLESLKTVEKLKEKIPNILLVLAGKADEKYQVILKNYIKKNKLEKYVLFTGNLNREGLRDLYSASNAGLFPIKSQGGWLAPFELLCAGKPIIVSEDMTAASLIKQFNLGVVSKNYEDVISDIYKNGNKYNQYAKKASIWVRTNLSWNSFTEKMIKAFWDSTKRYN